MAIDLITGHQGVSHISADQIATINNAMMDNFGANKVMRLVGGELTADGLTITISEGYWRVNGFDMEIQEGETLYIDPTTIGLSRIDDIYVEILQDIPTGAQRAEIYIALGEPSATPTAPDEPTAPYLNTDILLQIIKLARVTVSEGAMIMEDYSVAYNIVTPEDLNTVDVKASSALSSATNALGMIQDDSDAYSSSKSYKVGDYVVHEDKIYKCITACSAAAWSVNQNCFEETTLTAAVTELNSDLNVVTTSTFRNQDWLQGSRSTLYRLGKLRILYVWPKQGVTLSQAIVITLAEADRPSRDVSMDNMGLDGNRGRVGIQSSSGYVYLFGSGTVNNAVYSIIYVVD